MNLLMLPRERADPAQNNVAMNQPIMNDCRPCPSFLTTKNLSFVSFPFKVKNQGVHK
jgi:hypothetical protein